MKKLTLLCLAATLSVASWANNIVVGGITLTGKNTTDKFQLVGYNVNWDNSWRTATNESNWDGAWLFVKYRRANTQDWRHATLNVTGGTAGAGAAYSIPADGKGAFIYRSAAGIGNVNFTGNNLRWNYGVDGVGDNETVEVRVFAVEMVYVPAGSFWLGSGGTETNAFKDGNTNNAFQITSNSSISTGASPGLLNFPSAPSTIPTAYPKGFNAFWTMKYEVSQSQYVDFLNHLDAARATVLQASTNYTGTHPNFVAPQPERAAGFIGFRRLGAIADWSGLRPMSEMEYEKMSRGANIPPVANEYTWGTTTANELTAVTSAGADNEGIASPTNANVGTGFANPVRVGIFARNVATNTREQAGAAYYGVLNLADNVYEVCFSAAATAPEASVHGDGNLAVNAYSDIVNWQTTTNFGLRGACNTGGRLIDARTSDRTNARYFGVVVAGDNEAATIGGRMVRTAP